MTLHSTFIVIFWINSFLHTCCNGWRNLIISRRDQRETLLFRLSTDEPFSLLFSYNITRTVKQYFLHMHPRILDHTHSVLHHSIFWFWGHSNALCHNVPNIQTNFRNLPVLDKDWSFPLRIWFAFAHNPQRQEKTMQWAW